eukprot:TRINITY_DN539_c0_g1_i7.p1 TRINITY_DN539_c0_g1~~TRINITY_DN539_c0_g1_i7.p1  ORF type:complete len:335 (-),score=43.76 TRINITY_DN539_c0_g1_i7:77-979(-)
MMAKDAPTPTMPPLLLGRPPAAARVVGAGLNDRRHVDAARPAAAHGRRRRVCGDSDGARLGGGRRGRFCHCRRGRGRRLARRWGRRLDGRGGRLVGGRDGGRCDGGRAGGRGRRRHVAQGARRVSGARVAATRGTPPSVDGGGRGDGKQAAHGVWAAPPGHTAARGDSPAGRPPRTGGLPQGKHKGRQRWVYIYIGPAAVVRRHEAVHGAGTPATQFFFHGARPPARARARRRACALPGAGALTRRVPAVRALKAAALGRRCSTVGHGVAIGSASATFFSLFCWWCQASVQDKMDAMTMQ